MDLYEYLRIVFLFHQMDFQPEVFREALGNEDAMPLGSVDNYLMARRYFNLLNCCFQYDIDLMTREDLTEIIQEFDEDCEYIFDSVPHPINIKTFSYWVFILMELPESPPYQALVLMIFFIYLKDYRLYLDMERDDFRKAVTYMDYFETIADKILTLKQKPW